MDLKAIIAKFEEILDQKLNEETLAPLVNPMILKALEAAKPADVMTPEQLAAKQQETIRPTLSQWMGDNLRVIKGGPPKYSKPDDFVMYQEANGQPVPIVSVASTNDKDAIQKSLYTSASASGGYLVPTEESRTLLDLTSNWEVVPGLCQQVPMRTNTITFPTLTTGLTAYWIPEPTSSAPSTQSEGVKQESTPVFGQMTITTHVLAILVYVSNQLLDDSDPAVDQILFGIFGRTLGAYFDLACLSGAGSATDPVTGLDSLITTNNFVAGASLDYDDIIDLIWGIYANAKGPGTQALDIIGHPLAEKSLLKIKDNEANYIYKRPTEGGRIPSLWGQNLRMNQNVTITAGSGSDKAKFYCGDFANYAYVGNSMNMTIKANPWLSAAFTSNQTAFLAEFRRGFQVSDETMFSDLSGVPTT